MQTRCMVDTSTTQNKDGEDYAAAEQEVVPDNNNDGIVYPLHPKKTNHKNYGINYSLVLMMQLLGIGPDGLSIIFAFLGIASSKGSYDKWKKLQDIVGIAEEAVSSEVMKENMNKELDILRDKAKKHFNDWYFTGGGSNATEQEKVQKVRDLLHINEEGRIGIAIQSDEGWQRRAIGLGGEATVRVDTTLQLTAIL